MTFLRAFFLIIKPDEAPDFEEYGDDSPKIIHSCLVGLIYDYEYIRNRKANIFIAVEPKAGKRTIQVTDRRSKKDFALFVKNIIYEIY